MAERSCDDAAAANAQTRNSLDVSTECVFTY